MENFLEELLELREVLDLTREYLEEKEIPDMHYSSHFSPLPETGQVGNRFDA